MRRIYGIAFILSLLCLSFFFISNATEKRTMRDAIRSSKHIIETIPIPPIDELNLIDDAKHSDATAYHQKATVNLKNAVVRPDSKKASVLIELSEHSANTIVAIVKCSNKSGKALKRPKIQAVIFRPGDDLVRRVECEINKAREGDKVAFTQAHVPDGAKVGKRRAISMFSSKNEASLIPEGQSRPPYKFRPYGELFYEMDVSEMKIRDQKELGTWSTALSHGRTQPANQETGYYGTLDMGAVVKLKDKILLHTKRFKEPIKIEGNERNYPFMSSVLSGHSKPETHFKYGSIEWLARMPSQRGTWPALWLLPTSGWPPEIDVYEGFSYNPEWTQSVGLSSSIHGGKKNKRSFKRSIFRLQMNDVGLSGDLTKEVHKYQARITPNWITIFVDDVETVRFENVFRGKTWYPIMTVAVRSKAKDSYTQGTTDMEIHSLKIWRAKPNSP